MDEMQTNEQSLNAAPKRRSRTPLIVGVIVILLAAAAFVGGRLLNNDTAALPDSGPQFIGQGGAPQSVAIDVETPPELPSAPPDVSGLFARIEDNGVFVTEAGAEGFGISVSEDGSVQSTAGGQEIEVVVTAETKVYKDVTAPPSSSGGPFSGTIEQKVELSTIDELGQNSIVAVWGQRRGERLIADVLFFSTPIFIQAPGAP